MAGSYPDAPAPKIFYESDGSVLLNGTTDLATSRSAANDESINGPNFGNYSNPALTIIFPELRDIIGAGWAYGGNASDGQGAATAVWTSVDTTNGIDGIWVQRIANQQFGPLSGEYRSSIRSAASGVNYAFPYNGIKGIRFQSLNNGQGVIYWNLYGYPTSTVGLDRFLFWHPTNNVALGAADLDFGNVGRLTTPTKGFRIKNNAAALTANSIVISCAELTPSTPTVVSQMAFDNAGGGFVAAPNIGNLAPGGISGLITQKFSPSSTAQLGLNRQRIQAVAGTWT